MLYLFYKLDVNPKDAEAAIIKKNINMDHVCSTHKILVGQEVIDHYNRIHTFCPSNTPCEPKSLIDLCFTEYIENNHTVTILFYRVNNPELLNKSNIMENESKDLLAFIRRTIDITNNLLNEMDIYYNAILDDIIRTISEPRYYKLSPIMIKDNTRKYNQLVIQNQTNNFNPIVPTNSFVSPDSTEYLIENLQKIKLFDYQRDNVLWMLELEKNPICDYITGDKMMFFPDGRIFNYSKGDFMKWEDRELIPIRGGLVLDNVGVGKTFQMLSLAVSDTSLRTLILVPDHLESHWNAQWIKHFIIEKPNFIKIIKYSDFENFTFNTNDTEKYDRMIVDEIHELYALEANKKKYWNQCLKTKCKYKWGVSATPFPVKNSIMHILNFLTEQNITYPTVERNKHYYDTYYKIFRKNTLENITAEIKLPDANEHNVIIDFNDQERMLYDAEVQAKENCDENHLRKYCCDIMFSFKNKSQLISLKDFNKLVLDKYRQKYEVELEKLNKHRKSLENCLVALERWDDKNYEFYEITKFSTKKEILDTIKIYEGKIKEQQEIVKNRFQAYEYLNNKINDSNKECPICMGDIEDDDDEECSFDVPECGHICCSSCMCYWLHSNSACTICRRHINIEKMYTVTKMDQVKMNYSSKISKLMEIIESKPSKKFIVYTQFDELIDKLYQLLNTKGINSIKLEKPENIEEFRNDPNINVLILSSVKNASGIDLSFVSNIIIFEPIIGDTLFLRDIEKQIIGRIYRINQTQNIDIYRFIIRNTIEEQIFNKSQQLALGHYES